MVLSLGIIQSNTSKTSLFISYDNGNSFEKKSLKVDGNKDAIINVFTNSPTYNSRVRY